MDIFRKVKSINLTKYFKARCRFLLEKETVNSSVDPWVFKAGSLIFCHVVKTKRIITKVH
jgi:hypothetical protein